VPDFIALSKDAETVDAARTIARVLLDDLNFEHEFALIPRDVYATIPPPPRCYDVPLDRWREVNADGVIIGTVQKVDTGVRVEVRLFKTCAAGSRPSGASTAARSPTRACTLTSFPTMCTSSSGAARVARTKLTFNSDRDGERMVGHRREAERQRSLHRRLRRRKPAPRDDRLLPQHHLHVVADARSIAYTSVHPGLPNIFVSHIYQGTREELTSNTGNNFLRRGRRRDAHRVRLQSRSTGEHRDLRHERRRIECAPAHEQSGR